MDIPAWLAHAAADADARGLPELKPLLETLARSTQALRDADDEFQHPAGEHRPRATDHADHAEGPQATDHADHAEGPQNTRNTGHDDPPD